MIAAITSLSLEPVKICPNALSNNLDESVILVPTHAVKEPLVQLPS